MPQVFCVTIHSSVKGALGFPRDTSIQLFHACLVNSQNYATRCRGQLNALLPEAARPRGRGQLCIELSTVPRGIVLTILPNRHEITVLLHNRT